MNNLRLFNIKKNLSVFNDLPVFFVGDEPAFTTYYLTRIHYEVYAYSSPQIL